MTDDKREPLDASDPGSFDRGFDAHQLRQARLGASMTPAERLAWLERKNAELKSLLGLARKADREAAKDG